MEWTEAVIETNSDGVEIVTAALMEVGIAGLQVEDDYEMRLHLENSKDQWDYADETLLQSEKGGARIKFYVTADAAGAETMAAVRAALHNLRENEDAAVVGGLLLSVDMVNDEDWLENWKKYYKPFRVGKRIVIRPTWEDYEAEGDELVFTINPGHVFGTGLHQSTRLCIAALERFVGASDKVLDVGCGSGILSILALMLGAGSALAVDIEPSAVDIAYENAAMNGIGKDKYTVLSGNLLADEALRARIAGERYDVVAANIVADVIIALAPIVSDLIKPNGRFISSGIIKERAGDVAAALAANGFIVPETNTSDEWVCLVAEKR